ncbi:ABC transporter permease [Actinobacteria bacterium YIM 96077]|uniref:Autoinducer 2 import system permease protein LsrD n=2 Tax=Phytoactinopolyspora halophila TaxID=1981511 RepID=A0A329QE68_9ACTN|nr:ABC transporter permease [Actinobacteria bacterium YIM 96077]RAW10763.1 ABC transporter permease [Phytoactinopolyspora halophila]
MRDYAVLILLGAILVVLALVSPSFFTFANLMNVANQSAPLAMIATAGTFVIISGNFDLSTGAMFAVGGVSAAAITVATGNPWLGLVSAPLIGLVLGLFNGIAVTTLKVHSFLATLATSLVFSAIAVLITGGSLITVTVPGFTDLGRQRVGGVFLAVILLATFIAALWFVLKRTIFGRHVFAVGGNSSAAELSGIRVSRIRISVFALSGLAAGLAAAISVSRIASGQPQAGLGMELEAIAAIILGGTSIYGGVGAVWRSVAGVYLIALIGNGFDIMNVNPQLKNLVTGVIILAAVALAAAGNRRR